MLVVDLDSRGSVLVLVPVEGGSAPADQLCSGGRGPSLDTARAAELRGKAANGVSKAALAREFGISRETVYAYLRAEA